VAKKLSRQLGRILTDTLQNLFAPHGAVQSAQVIVDRDTAARRFGFVEEAVVTSPRAIAP